MTPALLYLLIAVCLIGTELLIMQFSVFWFLFFGLGALATSLICWVLPTTGWFSSAIIFIVASGLISLLLYPLLRNWQRKESPIAGNDAIGQRVKVTAAISAQQIGKVTWSGTEWPAQTADPQDSFVVGDSAIIKKLEGIRLFVGR